MVRDTLTTLPLSVTGFIGAGAFELILFEMAFEHGKTPFQSVLLLLLNPTVSLFNLPPTASPLLKKSEFFKLRHGL